MSDKTHKIFSSRANNLDANTYVGESGRLFYDEPDTTSTAPVLRYSDGITVGGVPLFGANTILPPDAVGFLYDDGAGNLSWSSTPTSYSDANVAIYLSTTANLDLGNLYIADETIGGKITDRDITLSPAGTGGVAVPSLKIPVGSIISNTAAISVTIADLTLESVVEYSTSTVDNLLIGDYGLNNGISGAAPGWAVYRFTTTPAPVLQIGDHLAATGMPFLSNVLFVGNVSGTDSANANIVITSQTLQGLANPPEAGAEVFTTRDVVNSGFLISTQANTDISFVPGAGGSTITAANFLPFIDDTYDLGSPARRFKRLWMGAGTIYVLDETLGTDQTIGAKDGNLYIGGGSGLTVGKFTFYSNIIALNNASEDFYIGSTFATGNLNINRPLQVLNSSGNVQFAVDRTGRTQFYPPTIPANDVGAVSIIGSTNGEYQPVINSGGMLHITGNDGAASRITNDAFGTGVFPAYISRAGRGTAVAPSAIQSGDILSRLSTVGWGTTNFVSPTTPAATNIEVYARENFTDTAGGTEYRFYTAPVGSATKSLSLTINDAGLSLVNTANVSAGVRFRDNTLQTTAWVPANNIQQITVGTGFEPGQQGVRTGNISLDTVDVHSVVSASYSLTVANITPNSQRLRLTLAQEIGSNSSPTFANVYVEGNLYVAGNIISEGASSINGKILYLANNSVTSADINGGGIQLGANGAAYVRTLKYYVSGVHGDYWATDADTGFETEHLNATDVYLSGNIFANGTAFFGGAHNGFVFDNAGIQSIEDVNDFAQIVNQNINSGTNASSDIVATNNLGDDTNYFVDMGINSSNYNGTPVGWTVSGANDAYLYNAGGNLTVGTSTSGTKISFHVGGTLAGNTVAVLSNTALAVTGNITATGNVAATYYFGNAALMSGLPVQVNSDWNNVDAGSFANIRNRPDLSQYATVTQLTTNVTTLTASINTLTANAAFQQGEISGLRANITAANVRIQTISANLGAYQTYVNANIGTDRIWLSNLQSNVGTINANLGAYQIWANAQFISGNLIFTPNTLTSTTHIALQRSANVVNLVTDATTANVANTIVVRDATGTINVSGWTVGTHLTAVNYTATTSDYWIGTTVKNLTITLPNAANGATNGRQYQIVDTVHSGNPQTDIVAQSPATVSGNQPSQQAQVIIATYVNDVWYLT